MTATAKKETLGFQTEVKQLLHLMINSLYSNKEIFLRELISNAADASDKLRFQALSNDKLLESDPELSVRVSFDEKVQTVTISDNGIGMNRDDVISHLGTIAKSGTKEFLGTLTGDEAKDAKLIGQFGVGFYSAFIVADKVTVETRKAGDKSSAGVRWESDASGEYTVENIDKVARGTTIVLHLKKEEKEFLDHHRLQELIKKYSDHINLPVIMKVTKSVPDDSAPKKKSSKGAEESADSEAEDDEPKMKDVEVDETINAAKALWTVPKSDITKDEYKEFYKHISHDFDEPLTWSHNKVEGKFDYTSLLYLPKRAPFDLFDQDQKQKHGLKLYIQRVFVMDEAENFLPRYLRFIKGIIDCKDLPLNISREILQRSTVVDKIRSACIKRGLAMIEKIAKDKEKYDDFWKQFGNVIKEGIIEDSENKDKIAKICRFSTTKSPSEAQDISLNDYIARMQEKQDKIYYITGESYAAAKNSPHLEIFAKKDIEVLLLTDRVDEWVATHLTEFDGKSLQSVAKGELDLGDLDDKKDKKEEQEKVNDAFKSVLEQMKKILGEKVTDVRLTDRLTSSPGCIVVNEHDMTSQMQQILAQAGHAMPANKPVFEINPEHNLIIKLKEVQDDEKFSEWTHVLLDEAILAEGGQLDDPAGFVQRLNGLLAAA